MPELLNEGAVFGGLNVAPAVDNCFSSVCQLSFVSYNYIKKCHTSNLQTTLTIYGCPVPVSYMNNTGLTKLRFSPRNNNLHRHTIYVCKLDVEAIIFCKDINE